jgi:hypothetical protein
MLAANLPWLVSIFDCRNKFQNVHGESRNSVYLAAALFYLADRRDRKCDLEVDTVSE